MKKFICALLTAALSLGFCGCRHEEAQLPQHSVKINMDLGSEKFPEVDGSPALLDYYSGLFSSAPEDALDGGIACSGSEEAYRRLVDGDADLIFAFLPSAETARYAQSRGVTLVCTPVINEGIVFFTDGDNPVEGLSKGTLAGIYSGKIADWKELGGNKGEIKVLEAEPGSEELAELLIRLNFPALNPDQAENPQFPSPAFTGCAEPGSAGTLAFAYLHDLESSDCYGSVKLLSIDGIAPTKENIATGYYPMATQAYAVYRGGEENFAPGKVARWCAGPEGRKFALERGYIPNSAER